MNRRALEGTITEKSLKSEELREDVSLLIYTPPNFTPLRSYDVLICQDGNDYFQLGRIPRQIEHLIEEGEIEETIIVGIPYPSVTERRKRYHPNGEKCQNYIRFLANELMPFIDREYPTHQLASSRTLAGDSLAGTVSLLTALHYPALFGQVMMHSPYVNETVLESVTKYAKADLLSIYHVIGIKETEVKTTDGQILDFLTPNRQLHALLKEKPFAYTYDEFDGDHTWTYWQKDLPRGLTTLLS
ncbi:alpha/beta hydrolase-fold protein [Alkalihalobacillus sp. MEB130]|uniref:esterase family protein n=1 Tax=Alkalihalobacillus sp. MEB130 TaxID=2976704 RepID=UPI0028DEDA22|nr:alpha/beta hydrolase-fold protein [Alkalihalobacillus sp. MEB130]MDT8861709.1 alpha/beta hydrolase-fold protein [Alkalihalobacillus sp. MEB130]